MEWVRVDERMPAASGSYLVFKANSPYSHGIYEYSSNTQCWDQEWIRKKRSEFKPRTWVTHWMPLPEPPK